MYTLSSISIMTNVEYSFKYGTLRNQEKLYAWCRQIRLRRTSVCWGRAPARVTRSVSTPPAASSAPVPRATSSAPQVNFIKGIVSRVVGRLKSRGRQSDVPPLENNFFKRLQYSPCNPTDVFIRGSGLVKCSLESSIFPLNGLPRVASKTNI